MRLNKGLIFICPVILLLFLFILHKGSKSNNNDNGMPDFKYNTIDKQFFETADIKDDRGRVIFIRLSTDCDNCQHLVESLTENYKKFTETSILIITKNDSSGAAEFYRKFNLNRLTKLKILLDKEPIDSMSAFKSYLTPTSFIFKQGKLVNRIVGDVRIDSLLAD
jgi:thiol-disulfide isomerase/thioredoxin